MPAHLRERSERSTRKVSEHEEEFFSQKTRSDRMSSKTVGIFAALMLLLSVGPRSSSHNITWKRGPDIHLPRGGYSAAVFQGGVLVVGGVYWKGETEAWPSETSTSWSIVSG